jgi:hypothetical protein
LILPAIVGFAIVLVVLWDAFETVVLPRRVARRFRLARLFFVSTWAPWRAIARFIRRPKQRETFLSYYGPLSLLFLFALWAALMILGFGILYYSASGLAVTSHTLLTNLYLSGTTFFTLGLGDVTAHTWTGRWLTVAESGLGFGFLALVLSYLPVIYQAFSRREVSIVLLDARAGSPPTAAELLRRHAGAQGVEALEKLLHEWERWSAEILESHVSYPVVSYFRSQHNNESWLSALAAILDACALLIACDESGLTRQSRLTFAMCRHTVVDLTQVFHRRPLPASTDRLPPDDMHRLRATLAQAGFHLKDSPVANEKLAKLRGMYEPYLQAMSRFLSMDLPPWILAKEISDNWKTSAWGRIAGLASSDAGEAVADDHSD